MKEKINMLNIKIDVSYHGFMDCQLNKSEEEKSFSVAASLRSERSGRSDQANDISFGFDQDYIVKTDMRRLQ